MELGLQFNGDGHCSVGGVGDVGREGMSISEMADEIQRKIKAKERFAGGSFAAGGGSYKFLDDQHIEIKMIGAKPEKCEIRIAGNRLTTKFDNGKTFEWDKDEGETKSDGLGN